MRYLSSLLPAGAGPARRLGALGAGLLSLGLLTGCPTGGGGPGQAAGRTH